MKRKPPIKWDVAVVWTVGIIFSIFAWWGFIHFLQWLSQYV